MDGKLLIATSSTGMRDTIYVGFAERQGDMLLLRQASMILRYEEVGVPGIATQPEKATRLRHVTHESGRVWIPLGNITAMVEADAQAWESHLGVSRG